MDGDPIAHITSFLHLRDMFKMDHIVYAYSSFIFLYVEALKFGFQLTSNIVSGTNQLVLVTNARTNNSESVWHLKNGHRLENVDLKGGGGCWVPNNYIKLYNIARRQTFPHFPQEKKCIIWLMRKLQSGAFERGFEGECTKVKLIPSLPPLTSAKVV